MKDWIIEKDFVLWNIEIIKQNDNDVTKNQSSFIGISKDYLDNVLRKTAGNEECSS